MTETPSPNPTPKPPTILDRVKRPAGVLPKNIQTWVILGVALLMIAILALDTPQKTGTPPEGAIQQDAVIDPNESRIQEYRRRIEERAQKLAAERARLEQAQQALAPHSELPAGPSDSYVSPQYPQASPRPERSAIEQDKKERAYKALFASNVALSYRPKPTSDRQATPFPTETLPTQPASTLPFAGPVSPQPSFPFYPLGAGPVLPPQQIPTTASSAGGAPATTELGRRAGSPAGCSGSDVEPLLRKT